MSEHTAKRHDNGSVPYITVDVFTTTPFHGNPLAVIPDARGLSDALMQRIAVEFNYSEVTFVLPPENPQNTARVRIFTPTCEVPFAGHPNVGTAFVLGQNSHVFGQPVGDTMRFEEGAGLVKISLLRERNAVVGAAIKAPRALALGLAVEPSVVARCVSLEALDIITTCHVPVTASVGLPFVFAEVSGLTALAKARPNVSEFAEAHRCYPNADGLDFALFLYVRTCEAPLRVRARMFAPLDNVSEDPATGSASAALAAYLVSLEATPDVHAEIIVEQGVEMGRPSVITLEVQKTRGVVHGVRIQGTCVSVMQGTLQNCCEGDLVLSQPATIKH